MLAYTIEAALNSKYISDVIISTDDQDIADVAVSYGALCPFLRPKYLASDDAMAIDTYIYTVNRLNKERGSEVDAFVVLQPTSPLRMSCDIDGSIELFKSEDAESVVSYTEEHHPISWHKYIDSDGRMDDIFTESIDNRQSNRATYYPNGAVYVFSLELILTGKYFSGRSFAYIMPRERSIDIDTADDFDYAEFMMMRKRS